MKRNEKASFGKSFSPYMTEEKIDINSWYEEFKNDPDKTTILNGCVYNKIIFRCEFYIAEPCSMIVFIDSPDILRLEDILMDENGNEYVIKGFEMFRFSQIPEWYPRITPMLIQGSTYNIGRYLTKKLTT